MTEVKSFSKPQHQQQMKVCQNKNASERVLYI